MYSWNLNLSDYIELNTNFTKNGYFLVDSQSDITLIKIGSLVGDFDLDKSETIEIQGLRPSLFTWLLANKNIH